jgi:hypothetical protein
MDDPDAATVITPEFSKALFDWALEMACWVTPTTMAIPPAAVPRASPTAVTSKTPEFAAWMLASSEAIASCWMMPPARTNANAVVPSASPSAVTFRSPLLSTASDIVWARPPCQTPVAVASTLAYPSEIALPSLVISSAPEFSSVADAAPTAMLS